MRMLRLIVEERPIRDNEPAGAGSERAVRMLAQAINSNSQGLGQQPVVGVEENQVFAPALLEPCVSGACNSQIFLANVRTPGEAARPFPGLSVEPSSNTGIPRLE